MLAGLPKREAGRRFNGYDNKLKSAMAYDLVAMLYLLAWMSQQDPNNTTGYLVVDTKEAMLDAHDEFKVVS